MKIKSIGNPIVPRNALDPANQFSNIRSSKAQLVKRYKNINRGMKQLIASIDKRVVPDSEVGGIVTNIKYEYLVDAERFQSINLFIQRLLYGELLDNEQGLFTDRWWLNAHLDRAYLDGTNDALQSSKNMASVDVVGVELSRQMRSIELNQIVFSRGYLTRVALVESRVFNEMLGLTDSTRADLSSTLARGMARGVGVRELTNDVVDRVGVSFRRAKTIVRTEILNSYRIASAAETDELNEDVYDDSDWGMESLWFSALASTSRRWHVARHGKTFTTEEVREFYSRNGNAINCYLPDTRVAGRFIGGVKSNYVGKAIEIVTSDGRRLRVTPNHPILTDRGLVAAGDINKGCNVFTYGDKIKDSAGVSHLDNDDGYSLIKDKFTSISKVGRSFTAGVTAIDFHGDGEFIKEDINVVLSDSVLPGASDPSRFEFLDDISLKHANSELSPRKALSSLFEGFFSVNASSSRFLSFFNNVHFVRIILANISNFLGFVIRPILKSELIKPPVDCNSANAVLVGQSKNRNSSNVLFMDFGNIKAVFNSVISNFVPSFTKSLAQEPVSYTKANGDFLDGLPVKVSTVSVVEVNIFDYSGHVYDLQELSGLMVAEGIIASNCLCSQSPVLINKKTGEILQEDLLGRMAKRRDKLLATMPIKRNQPRI